MFGEFEDAKDAQNADDDKTSATLGRLTVAFRLLHGEDDEVRDDREYVEHVHHIETELSLGWTGDQSHDELDAEPCHADCLHDVKWILYNVYFANKRLNRFIYQGII